MSARTVEAAVSAAGWRRGVDAFRVLTRRSRLGSALPAHVQHMGGVRGVLVTTFPLAACLAETLRVNMALLAQTRLALSGQDDQKSRIFQYFTSPQFHERMATIAEQFQQMQVDLAREKAAMNRTWAKREKQIETIVSSTAKFTGELQALWTFPVRAAAICLARGIRLETERFAKDAIGFSLFRCSSLTVRLSFGLFFLDFAIAVFAPRSSIADHAG